MKLQEKFNKIINEKESWLFYIKDLLGPKGKEKFKNKDEHRYLYYMNAYKKSEDVADFEQNYLEDLQRDYNRIELK